mgnify:CR=1 FL=1
MILFLFVTTCSIYGQRQYLFNKAPKHYKIREYLIDGEYDYTDIPIKIEFNIWIKRIKCVNKGDIYVSFGCNNCKCFEKLQIKEDTVFHFSDSNNKVPLFILSDSLNKDTIHVSNFGTLTNSDIVFNKKTFSSKIKDTIYVFSIMNHKNALSGNIRIVSSDSGNKFYFSEIAISKKYGFVWIKYKYHGVKYEIRFW